MSFLFVAIGGGFTTFSLEAITLFENKMYFFGGLYIILSVAFCLLSILCGKKLAALTA